ncbi:MAG: AI-2E family transporter [Cyclobacteriaceae bacterium]|nr:AI-2E family transporter [Cyclobacteriaceae bacterium]
MRSTLFGGIRPARLGNQQSTLLLYLQYVLYGSLILYFGRDVFIPLGFAVLISFVLYPSCAWMERKGLGRMTAIVVNLLILTLVVIGLTSLLVQQFVGFVKEWPVLQEKLLDVATDISRAFTRFFGVSQENQAKLMTRLTDELAGGTFTVVRDAISLSAFTAVALILIPVYTVLILYYRHHWVKVLYRIFPAERNENTKEILVLTIQAYFSFIKGMGIVYLVVGILNSAGLLLLGVPHPILFGFIASILTFIPYVGIIIGSLLPIAMAWTTYDSAWYAVGVVGIFTFVQYLEANVIFPVAVSNRLKVNTLVVLIAIFVGGILWGVSGMILFVPFVGIAKLIADHNHRLKTLSMLLGTQENHSLPPTKPGV